VRLVDSIPVSLRTLNDNFKHADIVGSSAPQSFCSIQQFLGFNCCCSEFWSVIRQPQSSLVTIRELCVSFCLERRSDVDFMLYLRLVTSNRCSFSVLAPSPFPSPRSISVAQVHIFYGYDVSFVQFSLSPLQIIFLCIALFKTVWWMFRVHYTRNARGASPGTTGGRSYH
jgi:hypothetical protein